MSVVPTLRSPTVRGGEIVTRLLAAEGVRHVFGIIDGTYFGLYSTLGSHGLELITPRHETSAVHMAAAYARLTGGLGVCIASNGPGVANALPGVAVENAEGNRVLLVTSSRRHAIVEPDRGGTFQCFPQTQAIAAMAKLSVHVPSFDRIAELTRRALRMCFTGRPGVVHLDIPEDLMNRSEAEEAAWFVPPAQYRVDGTFAPRARDVAAAADLLLAAERPLLHAGSGVLHAGATDALVEVAELLDAPLTTSWAARSAVDERHRLAIPMIYLDAVGAARNEADAVLVLGSRLGETDWWGKAPYWAAPADQRMIQVDLEPEVIGNLRPVDVPVQADVGDFLVALAEELRTRTGSGTPPRPPARTRWIASLRRRVAARRAKLDKHLKKRSLPMHPAHVPTVAQEVFGDDAILVVDGGNTAVWTNFFTQLRRPGSLLTTPKMGMLGAGCSQVLAAKVAHPDRPAYCILGDGAMGFHPQEVETAVRHGLNVVWIVLCDRQWGMVKMNQQFALKPVKTLIRKSLGPDETIGADLGEIEFDALARSMGAYGERVADPAGLRGALERAVASGRPAVVHVDVDPVAHMWAPNLKDFKDMHAEPGG